MNCCFAATFTRIPFSSSIFLYFTHYISECIQSGCFYFNNLSNNEQRTTKNKQQQQQLLYCHHCELCMVHYSFCSQTENNFKIFGSFVHLNLFYIALPSSSLIHFCEMKENILFRSSPITISVLWNFLAIFSISLNLMIIFWGSRFIWFGFQHSLGCAFTLFCSIRSAIVFKHPTKQLFSTQLLCSVLLLLFVVCFVFCVGKNKFSHLCAWMPCSFS